MSNIDLTQVPEEYIVERIVFMHDCTHIIAEKLGNKVAMQFAQATMSEFQALLDETRRRFPNMPDNEKKLLEGVEDKINEVRWGKSGMALAQNLVAHRTP